MCYRYDDFKSKTKTQIYKRVHKNEILNVYYFDFSYVTFSILKKKITVFCFVEIIEHTKSTFFNNVFIDKI